MKLEVTGGDEKQFIKFTDLQIFAIGVDNVLEYDRVEHFFHMQRTPL